MYIVYFEDIVINDETTNCIDIFKSENKETFLKVIQEDAWYFKNNEQFNEQDLARDVFEHREVISSFKKFKGDFQNEHELDVVGEFESNCLLAKIL